MSQSIIRAVAIAVGVTSFVMATGRAFGQTGASATPLFQSGDVLELNPPIIYSPSEAIEVPVEKFRRGFYQGAEVLGGYLADVGGNSAGMNQTFEEARVSFGIPVDVLTGGPVSMDNIIGLRPYFRVDHFDGPDFSDPSLGLPSDIDVPGSVYDTGVTLLNQKKWSEVFSTTLIVSPSIRSDFQTSDNAFRLFGLALLNWKPCPEWTVSAGVVYFDRNDFSLLPAFGVVYQPTPWWKFDFTMPRPRIARRMWKNGGQAEGWAFVGARIGGNTWAVKRDSGESDELTVRGFEILGGYEVIGAGNRGFAVETHYTFGRSIEYDRQDIEIDLTDAVGIRAAWQF
ncbi:TonB-dependent receptor [Rubripirellula tenax]|nr:TonB-dependent receptor [Rubripirellula tenax]